MREGHPGRLEEQQAANRQRAEWIAWAREALKHVQNTWTQIWSEHDGAELPDASRLLNMARMFEQRGKGRSCSLAAWIHSAAGEAARARGEDNASLFLDLA
eukprot:1379484-Amphidinium_carterae.1